MRVGGLHKTKKKKKKRCFMEKLKVKIDTWEASEMHGDKKLFFRKKERKSRKRISWRERKSVCVWGRGTGVSIRGYGKMELHGKL